MKTTVKAWGDAAMIVEPTCSGGGVRFTVRVNGADLMQLPLTLDQTGALIFGLEQAAEAAEIEAQRTATA